MSKSTSLYPNLKMKQYQLFSLLVVTVVLFSAGKHHSKVYFKQDRFHSGMFFLVLSCNPGTKTDEASLRPGTLPPNDWDEDLNSGEFSGHECGPVHGKCPYEQCCSLRNECGNSTSHCNLSLGCKKKWGICHWFVEQRPQTIYSLAIGCLHLSLLDTGQVIFFKTISIKQWQVLLLFLVLIGWALLILLSVTIFLC